MTLHSTSGAVAPGETELYRQLVESASDIMYRSTLEGRFTYANAAAVRITGYDEQALLGMHYLELVVPEQREALSEFYTRQQEEEIENTYRSFAILTRDGREVWLGQNVQLLRENGEVVCFQAIARDITLQREMEGALRESDERFRQLADHVSAAFWMIDAVSDEMLYASPRFESIWGGPRSQVLGTREAWIASIHPEDREEVRAKLAKRRVGDFDEVYRVVRFSDGKIVWIRDRSFRVLGDDGKLHRIVGIAEDITERHLAEEESRRLASLSRENPNPVIECDAAGAPVHVNPAAEQACFELGLQEVTGLLPRNHEQIVATTLESGEGVRNVEVNLGDRILSWTYRPDSDSGAIYMFAVDITGRRLMEEQLRHDALHDALTGLPNRLLFMERLTHSIARAKRREAYLFAVLFLDLDRFKVINDSLGHHVGDELLILIAQRLQRCLRNEDTVARFGGDEFAILLEEINGISDATRVAERIQAELSASVNLNGFDVFTSASIGIALSSSAYERPEYLLRNADMAMYRAKGLGQARFEVFDRTMHAQALARLQLESDLRRALERGEFVVHYQPIVEIGSGEIRGMEALVRWRHPDQGLMAPDEFIPVAEETGVILPIGRWVLAEACRQGRRWYDEFGPEAIGSIGVNISAKQLSQLDLVEQWDPLESTCRHASLSIL